MEISYTREAVRELTRARAIERKKKNSRLREYRPSGASKKHRKAADQRRKPSNPASTKKRHPPVAAITAKQERHRAVKLKRPSLKANVPTDCNLDYLRAGYVGKPQVGETSVYASVTTGDVPIPLKTDHAHRVRIIWFNDLNDEYTFNRQFTQARMLYALIRYRQTELKHPVSQLERQFVAACLEHDLKDDARTWVREGFINLWLGAPESALPVFSPETTKIFKKSCKEASEPLREVQMPVAAWFSGMPVQDPSVQGSPMKVQELFPPGEQDDELDMALKHDDYNTRSWDVVLSNMYPFARSNEERSAAHKKKWLRIAEEFAISAQPDLQNRLHQMSFGLHRMT